MLYIRANAFCAHTSHSQVEFMIFLLLSPYISPCRAQIRRWSLYVYKTGRYHYSLAVEDGSS